jgi:hypothetical protein
MADIAVVEDSLRRWDPIGVMPGQAGPGDEYDSYAPQLLGMLQRGSQAADVQARLSQIRTVDMGLPGNSVADARIAAELVGWWLAE